MKFDLSEFQISVRILKNSILFIKRHFLVSYNNLLGTVVSLN